MNKKTAFIIGLQAVLIVTLFWMIVFYGKDEFAEFQREQDEEEIESQNRVSTKDGVNIVSIPQAAQTNSGIKTAPLAAAIYRGEIKSFGNVVALDSLFEAKTQLLNLQSELGIIKANSTHNVKQYQRLKALNADDKNVSDKAVQEAFALINADKSKISAIELQIKNLKTNVALKWGEALAKLVGSEKLPEHLEKLMNSENVLVQVGLPVSAAAPEDESTIQIAPVGETGSTITATYISPASMGDAVGLGKTYFYSAPAEILRIGMRVSVQSDAASGSLEGVVVPDNAVVWYAGNPWIYIKQGQDQFVRKPITTDTEMENGWFNQNIKPNSDIVVKGAQLLLSEEFKYQIKNENED